MNVLATYRQDAPRLLLALLALTGLVLGCQDLPDDSTETEKQIFAERAKKPDHQTKIVSSRELGTLEVRVNEERTAGVRCSVCHSIERDGPPATRPDELDEFHTDMKFGHGDLTCNACHHPDDRDLLRLADGQSLAFEDTITLCAQCHGTQMRDYRKAAHGGMSGHWDLKAGPRTRNHCVNCHDPHAPGFPSMIPAPPPRDRLMPEKHPENQH